MKALIAWGITVIAAYIVFLSLSDPRKDIADPYIVGMIGFTLLAAGIIMLLFTRVWSPRALGMMSVALGCGVLYIASLLFYVAPETRRWSDAFTTAVRAFLVVGGPLWAWGIIRYVQGVFFDKEGRYE